MAAELWREVRGQVHKGPMFSVIEDRGFLRKAMAGSTGYYLFSEAGAGVQPLILIGMWNEALNWTAKQGASGIDNRIQTLPDIYMGIALYKPGQRFKGLFPVHDAVKMVAENLTGLVPGSEIMDIGGAISDSIGIGKDLFGGRKKKDKGTLADTPVYVKFSYLQEDGMARIGRGRMAFSNIHPILVKALSAMSPL